ncbi:hypothetical protein GE09DRAFT_1051695 [Coniochaeta sp. 2T2.1]|nr:hypothetical protein GE09DRAFT_1051695 [Coniochaeta sp. 2T2.1]
MAPPKAKAEAVKPPQTITPAHLQMRGFIFGGKTYPNVVLEFLYKEKPFHTKHRNTLADRTIQSLVALMQTIVFLGELPHVDPEFYATVAEALGWKKVFVHLIAERLLQARQEYTKKCGSDRSFSGIRNNSDFTEHEARMRTLVDSYQSLLNKPAKPFTTWKKGDPVSARRQQLIRAIRQMIMTAPEKLLRNSPTLPEFPNDPSCSHVANAMLTRLDDRARAAMDYSDTSHESSHFIKNGSVATKDAHSRKGRDRTRSRRPGPSTGNRRGNTAEGARSTFRSRSPLPARSESPSSPLFCEDSDATENNATDEVKTVKTVKVATKENRDKNVAHPTTSLKAIDNSAVTARAKNDRARSKSPGRDGGSLQDKVKKAGGMIGMNVGKNSGREMRSRSPLRGTTNASSVSPLMKKAKDTMAKDAAAWDVPAKDTPTEGTLGKETLARATRSNKRLDSATVEQQKEGDLYKLKQGANKEARRKMAIVTPVSYPAGSPPLDTLANKLTKPLKDDHAKQELPAKDEDGEHVAALKEELRQPVSLMFKTIAKTRKPEVQQVQAGEPVPTEYDRDRLDAIVWKTKALVEETGDAQQGSPALATPSNWAFYDWPARVFTMALRDLEKQQAV